MRRCPRCMSKVPDNSLTCPSCFTPVPRRPARVPSHGDGRKSGTICMALALIPGLLGIWGLGHVYLGERERGLGFLALGVAMTLGMLLLASASDLVLTLICLVFLALAWLSILGYQAFEALALAAAKGATPPRLPWR